MDKQYFILYNPISGNGSSKKIISKLKADLDMKGKSYFMQQTESPGHAKHICKTINGCRYLIIIGGDGTFNECVNGLMLNKLELPTIGFLPGGTGNSVMHDLKAKTYRDAINLIFIGNTKKIDVLKLTLSDRVEYSINIVGWGMVSDINLAASKMRFLGSSRYTIASIYHVFKKHTRQAKIIIDRKEREDDFLFILTLNTIHTGKGMQAAPDALMDDGLIDIVILKSNISKLQLLKLLPKIFTGKHILSDKIDYLQAKKIIIKPKIQEILNIDGEMKCKTPVEISVLKNRIKIFSS